MDSGPRTQWNSFQSETPMMTNIKGEFRNLRSLTSVGNDGKAKKYLLPVNTNCILPIMLNVIHIWEVPIFLMLNTSEKLLFNPAIFRNWIVRNYRPTGALSMKEKFFIVEFAGLRKDPGGILNRIFYNRKINIEEDWGLNWNAAPDAGGVLVSDDVRMTAELQFFKKLKVNWGFIFRLSWNCDPWQPFLPWFLFSNARDYLEIVTISFLLLHRPAQWLKIYSLANSETSIDLRLSESFWYTLHSSNTEELCSKCLVTFIFYKHSISHRFG